MLEQLLMIIGKISWEFIAMPSKSFLRIISLGPFSELRHGGAR